jgi:Flp pilus assembly protein TadD
LNEFYTQSANTRGLNRLFTVLVARNPEDMGAKNNLAVTAFLLGLQNARAHELAREVFTRYPSNESCASTYAYSLYLQGKRDEALKAFAGVNRSALEQPAIALYYGVVLGTNAPAEATRYLDLAAQGKLLPEEKALLDNARKGL